MYVYVFVHIDIVSSNPFMANVSIISPVRTTEKTPLAFWGSQRMLGENICQKWINY